MPGHRCKYHFGQNISCGSRVMSIITNWSRPAGLMLSIASYIKKAVTHTRGKTMLTCMLMQILVSRVVERLFLTVPRGCLQFVIVVFPDHTHLLFLMSRLLCLCCVVTVKSFPVLAFNVVIITIVRIYT